MTDLAATTTTQARVVTRAMPTIAAGLLGGAVLGVLALAWMRLIAKDPAFTWNGTLFIVGGFTMFGLTQSIGAVARRRTTHRWTLTAVRAIGVAGLLPLFVAAGALMLPTVAGGGLALTRVDWRRVTRGIFLLIAAGPVLFVGSDLVGSFGWSLHAVVGFVAMLVLYATIIRAARLTFAPQAGARHSPDGRPSRPGSLSV